MTKVEVKKIKNIDREIKPEVARMLWAVSGGVCEFRGCNYKLYSHHVTGEKINLSEKSHIYAFNRGGKRFLDVLSRTKINDIDNLMMVCKVCHTLIDSEDTEYSADDLIQMKREHEERIMLLTSIKPNLKSEMIRYSCNIGRNPIKITDYAVNSAVIPEHYPAHENPIDLSPDLDLYDDETNFWSVMSTDLERKLNRYESNIRDKHISLFAVAPQPLLFKLGTLLNRNYNVDTRQPQEDISQWKWLNTKNSIAVEILGNEISSKDVALVIEITCGIQDTEIYNTCGEIEIVRIKTSVYDPKCIKSKFDLNEVISKYREVLNCIRKTHHSDVTIHLFTIAPASVSIEMGRQWMKGDPSIILYDRNSQTKKFEKALLFPTQKSDENSVAPPFDKVPMSVI